MLTELSYREDVPEAILAMADLAVGEHERAFRRFGSIVSNPSIGDQIVLSELKANPYAMPVLEERRWRELRNQIGAL